MGVERKGTKITPVDGFAYWRTLRCNEGDLLFGTLRLSAFARENMLLDNLKSRVGTTCGFPRE